MANRELFKSFIQFVVHAHPREVPGIGIGPSGNLLAAWHHGKNRFRSNLTVISQRAR